MLRRNSIALAVILALLVPLVAAAGTKSNSTWVSPDLQPATYYKVIVLAKTADEVAMRVLEDTVVGGLKKKGIEAVQAYLVLQPADLESDEAIEAKAKVLGADAGLVFTVTGESTEVKSGSNAYASVGVPVRRPRSRRSASRRSSSRKTSRGRAGLQPTRPISRTAPSWRPKT
jgi:hypothetical protein